MRFFYFAGFLLSSLLTCQRINAAPGMVNVPSGNYHPFTAPEKDQRSVLVSSFSIDRYLVTNADFLKFVKIHPEWRKSKVQPIFADAHYLSDWQSDLHFRKHLNRQPITSVSWFAASAYCESLEKELPTTDQWEYSLHDENRHQAKLNEKIIAWYGSPNQKDLPAVGDGGVNGFGISDLGFLVWEWTQDFNSFLSSGDSRVAGGKDANLFCGGGSQMGNPADYASFMRFSFRSSLKAHYTTRNLGFRCATGENK
jgi:sulfatase modifying factor 1